jgi:dynein heavy chain, axonemal
VLLASQIKFSKRVVECFSNGANADSPLLLRNCMHNLINHINSVANIVSSELEGYKLLTIEALLILEVHSRDILAGLIENNVNNFNEFEWTKYLRYEWDEQNSQCLVKQSDSIFNYGYEYLGCSPRLVITPLTDR